MDLNRPLVVVVVTAKCVNCHREETSPLSPTLRRAVHALRMGGWLQLRGELWLCWDCCRMNTAEQLLRILELHLWGQRKPKGGG